MAMGLHLSRLYAEHSATWIAPWAGDAAIVALRLALAQRGLECVVEDAFLKVDHRSSDDVLAVLRSLDQDGLPAISTLLGNAAFAPEQKFDSFVPEELLRESYGVRHLDREGATRALSTLAMASSVQPIPGLTKPS
jgi:hypothetical protein